MYKLHIKLERKKCNKARHIRIIIKIQKNVTDIVELAVKVEKSNCNNLRSSSKLIKIKYMLFRDSGW